MKLVLFVAAILASGAVAQQPSPAERKVAEARKAIESNPEAPKAYADLALALARRARETSDTGYYTQAEAAVQKAQKLDPANLDAQKIGVWIMLGRHEFARALEKAVALNKQAPGDVLVYGFLTDAHIELGDYAKAEKTLEAMLNLRAGNVPALTRTAYLRELFGDLEGAIEAMMMAFDRTPVGEVEDRAWILTQAGHLRLLEGRVDDAGRILEQALSLFPNYHYALGNLAKVRMAEQRYEDAVRLLEERYRQAPHPENLFVLAEAFKKAGQHGRARAAFREFETSARKEMRGADNANHELVLYYANHAKNPAEALRIAGMELARRRDVHTLRIYAWALHVNGKHVDARQYIERALKVGIQDPEFFYDAGVIAMKQGDRAAARQYLKKAAVLKTFWGPATELLAKTEDSL